MTPMLGILASSGLKVTNSYESIATVTTTGSSITFSSIPSTYKHLQVRFIGRCGVSGETSQGLFMRINGDSGSNYSRHSVGGNGSITYAGGAANSTYAYPGYITGPNATASNFGIGIIDFLDYANTNKYKTVRSLSGYDNNGGGDLALQSACWLSTSAITSLTFLVELGGGSFVTGTNFALYGIRG